MAFQQVLTRPGPIPMSSSVDPSIFGHFPQLPSSSLRTPLNSYPFAAPVGVLESPERPLSNDYSRARIGAHLVMRWNEHWKGHWT